MRGDLVSRTYLDRAIVYYGLTTDWRKAGFILPDGSLLDFSEGHPHQRIQDHRNVCFLMRDAISEREGWVETRDDKLRRFLRVTGCMRFIPEQCWIEVRSRATQEQVRAILQIAKFKPPFIEMVRPGKERFAEQYGEWNLNQLPRDVYGYWRDRDDR